MECGRCGDGSIEDIYCRGCGGGLGSSYGMDLSKGLNFSSHLGQLAGASELA